MRIRTDAVLFYTYETWRQGIMITVDLFLSLTCDLGRDADHSPHQMNGS